MSPTGAGAGVSGTRFIATSDTPGTPPDPRRSVGEAAGLFVLVFLAYAAGAVLSWQSFGATVGPAFFPSAGITVAAMLLARRSRWPAIVAAIVLAEFLVDLFYGQTPDRAAWYATANAVEPLIGASLTLAWCRGAPDLRVRAGLVRFVGGAVLAGPLIGGLLGGTVTALNSAVWWPAAVMHWFAGDAIGVLVVASPILLWPRQSYVLRDRPIEAAGILTAAALLAWAAFWIDLPPSLLILPVLAWAALRLDMLGAALAGSLVAFVANLLTVWGRGLYAGLDLAEPSRLALAQVFIAVNLLAAMLIAQEAAGRVNAVREREIERRERLRLETLAGLAQRLSAALTPKDIGRALADQVLNEAGARALSLGLVDPAGRRLEWVTMSGYPQVVLDEFGAGIDLADRTVTTDVVRTGQPVLIRTAAEYGARYPDKERWSRISRAETTVGWPLNSGGAAIGALLLVWSEPQPLDNAQRAYVSAVATMVGQALVRARIYSDQHARAAVLQAAVLPTGPVETGGLDISVAYEPADVAQGLGGDWYDVMALPEGRTYFAVGDVVGHGLQAVEDMAQLRSAGRALAHQGLSPARLLSELNGFTRHASIGRFATMAVAILDPGQGALAYCTAGHPPPFLRRAAGGQSIRLSGARGPVLGPVPGAEYDEGTVRVSAGDILVLYTDGLVERPGMDLETGLGRAGRMIAGWDRRSGLDECCQALKEALAPRPRGDDVCIIAVRFTD